MYVCVIWAGRFTELPRCGQMVWVNNWARVKTLDPPCLVAFWEDHKRRQVVHRVQLAVGAWHSLQPTVPPTSLKTSISNPGSGDSRLLCALRAQLCTIGDLVFCSAALLQRVFCPITWGRLKHFQAVLDQVRKLLSAGSLSPPCFRVFLSSCWVLESRYYREQNWQFSQNPISKNLIQWQNFWQLRFPVGNKLYYLAPQWSLPAVRLTATDANLQMYNGGFVQNKTISVSEIDFWRYRQHYSCTVYIL